MYQLKTNIAKAKQIINKVVCLPVSIVGLISLPGTRSLCRSQVQKGEKASVIMFVWRRFGFMGSEDWSRISMSSSSMAP